MDIPKLIREKLYPFIKFAMFCVLAISLFSILNSIFGLANQGWRDFYKLPRQSIDILFMGNSHGFAAFQPKIINDLLPVNSYMVSASGENIVVTYYELKEALKYQTPKVIILETCSLELTALKTPEFIFEFYDSQPMSVNKFKAMGGFFTLDHLTSIFPALRMRLDWNNPQEFVDMLDKSDLFKKHIDANLGYIPNTRMISESNYLNANTLPDPPEDTSLTRNYEYFQKMVDLCNKHNIRLILTTAPVLKISGEQHKFYMPVDIPSIADQYDLDYFRINPSTFTKIDYGDYAHLNAIGSISASIILAEDIAKTLGLSIDQQWLDYYNNLDLKDYSLTNQGEEFTLELIPSSTSRSLEYKFMMISDDLQTVYSETSWQQNNSFHFYPPQEGCVSVDTAIRNPEGDYSLNAIIKIDSIGCKR